MQRGSMRQRRVCPAVRPDVRPSHAGIVPERKQDREMYTITLVSGKVWVVEKFTRGHPPKERAKWGLVGFFGDFRPICRHISKTVHFTTKLLWDGNRKP